MVRRQPQLEIWIELGRILVKSPCSNAISARHPLYEAFSKTCPFPRFLCHNKTLAAHISDVVAGACVPLGGECGEICGTGVVAKDALHGLQQRAFAVTPGAV